MTTGPVQPFGRRGRPAHTATASAFAGPALRQEQSSPLPPEVLSGILGTPEQEAAAERPKVQKVARSLRAAVLAGVVVVILNAAVNATSVLKFGGLIDSIPLGQTKLPFAVMLAVASLWGGARASAFVLLFAHSFLNRRGWTSIGAYILAGGAATLAYALIVQLIGLDGTDSSIAMELLSGMGAGFFYRLFAAVERS